MFFRCHELLTMIVILWNLVFKANSYLLTIVVFGKAAEFFWNTDLQVELVSNLVTIVKPITQIRDGILETIPDEQLLLRAILTWIKKHIILLLVNSNRNVLKFSLLLLHFSYHIIPFNVEVLLDLLLCVTIIDDLFTNKLDFRKLLLIRNMTSIEVVLS